MMQPSTAVPSTKRRFASTLLLMAASCALCAVSAYGATEHSRNDRAEQGPDVARLERPRANQGRIPPPPMMRSRDTEPEAERGAGGRIDNTPHVNENHWYGHDRPDDPRYVLLKPFLYGHFAHPGPGYRYEVKKVDIEQHLFWLPGDYEFRVANWDWPIWSKWCTDCGDDFVVYSDPDHKGWYLVYDVDVGSYVHAEYLGRDAPG